MRQWYTKFLDISFEMEALGAFLWLIAGLVVGVGCLIAYKLRWPVTTFFAIFSLLLQLPLWAILSGGSTHDLSLSAELMFVLGLTSGPSLFLVGLGMTIWQARHQKAWLGLALISVLDLIGFSYSFWQAAVGISS